MEFWDFARSPAGVLVLVESARRRDVSAKDILSGSDLTQSQLLDPNFELAAGQELRVIRNLVSVLGNSTRLGLEIGLEFHFSTYGVWGFGLISSATGAAATALALRFLPLTYAFTAIAYHEEGRNAVLTFGEPDLAPDLRDFVLARDMAAAALLMQEINGPDFVLSRFMLTTPGNSLAGGPAIKLFGASVETGRSSNRLVFDRALLDRMLPQANPVTAAMCEQMCRVLLDRRHAQQGSGSLTRHYLNVAPDKTPSSLGDFARIANTSERTLKRRLRAEGTSFRQLAASSRRAMAEALLCDERLTLAEIAERLGFSDLSSFSQAFKRWSGVAPSQYRRELLARRTSATSIADEPPKSAIRIPGNSAI